MTERHYAALLGLPGAGKGSVAKRLSSLLGLGHLSTGDIFRREIVERTVIGRDVENAVADGVLAPCELVIWVVLRELATAAFAQGALFDGFPRTELQAQLLDRRLEMHGDALNEAILIDIAVSEEELILRTSARRVCPGTRCARSYGMRSTRPRLDGICDACGKELIRRLDDDPVIVRRRLQQWRAHEMQLRQYYERSNRLTIVKSGSSTSTPQLVSAVLDILQGGLEQATFGSGNYHALTVQAS